MTTNKPEWVKKFTEIYSSGIAHAFILHFNVNDYASADSNVPVAQYLQQTLASRIVALYSRDRGIEFATETMKREALDILGLAEQESTDNAALAALQAIGAAAPSSDQQLPRNPAEALPLLDALLRADNTAVIIDQAELIIPDGPLASMSADDRTALATISRWGRDSELISKGNPVFLLTVNTSSLHSDLRSASNRYESIEVPLPKTTCRTVFIKAWAEKRGVVLDDSLTFETVSNATAGLSLLHIEDILLRAEATGSLTQSLIWERKQDIIRSEFGDVLEIIEPRFAFDDVGGLDNVKRFFQRSVIRPIREGRKSRVPMGVLMTGPAGTGKSIMAEALAAEAGVNAVKLQIGGQIASKWQGEGERNLDKALRAIKGLSPTIVFIDEIDQAVQRGGESGGSQQDQRIFQKLLEFMSDTVHRGEVVFLAATNRPDLMDAALRRPGRFDKKIPFLIPEDSERAAIAKVMTRRYLGEEVTMEKLAVTATEGWTGAEIEAAVVKAVELIEDEDLKPSKALNEAVKRLSPSTSDIELMTFLAIRECNDQDLLPDRYKTMLNNRAELDQKIESATDNTRRQRSL